MTPQELKAEIQTGPLAADLAPHVASGNDGKIHAILHENRFTKNEQVPLRDIVRYLLDNNLWLAIVDATASLHGGAKQAARTFVEIQKMGFIESLDMSKPTAATLLNGLVDGAIITTSHRNAIVAMGKTPASRAEVLGTSIDIPQIAQALRGTV